MAAGYAGASFIGGVMYEVLGGQWLYLATGVAAFSTWLLHLSYLQLCPPGVLIFLIHIGISMFTLPYTLFGSSVVTSQPVTRQARVHALLKVQSFTDDQAVTVLLEDGVCGV